MSPVWITLTRPAGDNKPVPAVTQGQDPRTLDYPFKKNIQRDWTNPAEAIVVRYDKSAPNELKAAQRLPSVMQELENEFFIRQEDIEPFIRFAIEKKMFISVRRTGKDSIDRIREGLACKPHDILAKSLKPSSIKNEKKIMEMIQQKFNEAPPQSRKNWEIGIFADRAFRKVLLDPPNPQTVTTVYRLLHNSQADSTCVRRYRKKNGHSKRVPFDPEKQLNIRDQIFECLLHTDPDSVDGGKKLKEEKANDVLNIRNEPDLITIFFDAAKTLYERLEIKEANIYAGCVGWWFVVEVTAHDQVFSVTDTDQNEIGKTNTKQFKIPVGVLRVGEKKNGQKPTYQHGVPVAFSGNPIVIQRPLDGYTGDYDLHCLYDARKQLPVSELKFENADSSHSYQHNSATALWQLNAGYLKREGRNNTSVNDPFQRTGKIQDSLANLVQHGPQNLYRLFVEQAMAEKKISFKEFYSTASLESALNELEILSQKLSAADKKNLYVGNQVLPNQVLPDLPLEIMYSRYNGRGTQSKNLLLEVTDDIGFFDPTNTTCQGKVKEKYAELEEMKNDQKHRAAEQKIIDILVTPDDGGVLAFTPYGEVYILDSRFEVIRYYTDHGLVQNLWSNGNAANARIKLKHG